MAGGPNKKRGYAMTTTEVLRRADDRLAVRCWTAALRAGATPAQVAAAIEVHVITRRAV